jgi:hypothetical protein
MILLPRSELRFMQGTILALFLALIAAILVGHTAMEGLRGEFEGKLRAQANRQASLTLNGATYAVVHHHAGGWDATPEPIDLTPPAKSNNKKGVSK